MTSLDSEINYVSRREALAMHFSRGWRMLAADSPKVGESTGYNGGACDVAEPNPDDVVFTPSMQGIPWTLRNAGLVKHLNGRSRAEVLPVLKYPDHLLVPSNFYELRSVVASAA